MPVTTPDSERGAVLIQVAIVMLALTGFLMFVVDYGILWVSRSQAQTAADAGALAGAVALTREPNHYAAARSSAYSLARANQVFGEAARVEVEFGPLQDPDWNDDCADFAFPSSCEFENCVLVCVYRNQTPNRGTPPDPTTPNPLRMWIGPLLNLTEQGVAAASVAWIAPANATRCLKPWALVDRNATGTGTFGLNDVGDRVTFTSNPSDPGWFVPLALTADGLADYELTITDCEETVRAIGTQVEPLLNAPDPAGYAQQLIDRDPLAGWDDNLDRVVGSSYQESPRLITVPVFDPSAYVTGQPIPIANMIGLFLEPIDAQGRIVGRVTVRPGLLVAAGTIVEDAAFLNTVQLVR